MSTHSDDSDDAGPNPMGRSAPRGHADLGPDAYGCESALPFLTDLFEAPCAPERPRADGHRDDASF